MESRGLSESGFERPPVVALQTPALSIGRIVFIILVSTFIGALVGGLIGYLMGVTIPDFYRSDFNGGRNVDPVQMGTGLGISEGLALGFLLGLVIVLVQAFGKRKTHPG
jgi:hypothetical protein